MKKSGNVAAISVVLTMAFIKASQSEEHCRLPVIKTQDRAHEFRISIQGRLAGECVQEVASVWAAALAECLPRQIVVDISLLTGYDASGRKLLREMNYYGTVFSASSSASLVFLAEITAPRRRGVTVIPESVPQPMGSARDATVQPLRMRVAGGSSSS
jgi:hypothetical protein